MSIILNEVKDSVLVIDIIGTIGQSMFDESFSSANLNEKLNEISGYNTIELNISSLGGSAYEGLNIFNILEFLKTKGIKVKTNAIGAVASAGVTIFIAGDERNMLENSLMLVHMVSGSLDGKVEDIEEKVKQMQALNENLINIYSEKTGMSKDDIKELLNAEKWMNAKEAMKNGFVTSIIKAPKLKNKEINMDAIINQINESELPKVSKDTEDVEVTSDDTTVETVEVTEEQTTVEETKETETTVEETTETTENNEVSTDVVEPTITNEVSDVNNSVDIVNYINEITNLKNELVLKDEIITSLNKKVNDYEKSIKESEINTILNEAVRTQRIAVNLKETYRKLLTTNFDDTKELISKLVPNKSVSLLDKIEEKNDSRINWTIRDWEMKDSDGLREMKANNPERYQELYNNYYKK